MGRSGGAQALWRVCLWLLVLPSEGAAFTLIHTDVLNIRPYELLSKSLFNFRRNAVRDSRKLRLCKCGERSRLPLRLDAWRTLEMVAPHSYRPSCSR